jgi:curved DNA-binding protein
VGQDHRFIREGADLVTDEAILYSVAVLGGSLDVKTLDGTKRIKIPAGIQPGTKIRLKGLGFPHTGKSSRGDLYVKIGVKVPETLTSEQKKLVDGLAKAGL